MPRLFPEMGKSAMGNTVLLLECVRFEMPESRCLPHRQIKYKSRAEFSRSEFEIEICKSAVYR